MAAERKPATTGKPVEEATGLFGGAEVVVVDTPVTPTEVTPTEAADAVAGRRRPVIEIADDNTGEEVGRPAADPTQVALEAEATFGR